MPDFLQVTTVTETRDQAVALADSAVSQRLAAHAQIVGPVITVLGSGTGREFQLLLTTRADLYPNLEALLLGQHPWSNPEVCATAISAGSADYLAWLDSELLPAA